MAPAADGPFDCARATQLGAAANTDTAWPPRSVAARLMAARSVLDCHRDGVPGCRACNAAMELPLALARAADVAAADGLDDMAHTLIDRAYYVAELLMRQQPEQSLALR